MSGVGRWCRVYPLERRVCNLFRGVDAAMALGHPDGIVPHVVRSVPATYFRVEDSGLQNQGAGRRSAIVIKENSLLLIGIVETADGIDPHVVRSVPALAPPPSALLSLSLPFSLPLSLSFSISLSLSMYISKYMNIHIHTHIYIYIYI